MYLMYAVWHPLHVKSKREIIWNKLIKINARFSHSKYKYNNYQVLQLHELTVNGSISGGTHIH